MSDENITQIQTYTPIDRQLFESRQIFISGVVNAEMALKVNRELLAMDAADAKRPIVMWINSPGGEVYSGFSIYDNIQYIRPKVITVVSGTAASMGSVIALAADKENRLAMPNAKLLIHQPLIGGALRGSASEIDIHAKDIIKLKKRMHELYAERTGTSVEKFVELMERDYWVEPKEAITLGLISKIVTSRDDVEKLLAWK